ncbi:hypothetical protein OG559_22790 [Micromonospora sp. NBC_01405]|uniref:hypothetical protein n=1 Tax=Micromonospora sp. NBC_01405 TaxID=2903589 RepID=UPI00324994DA
MWLRQDRPDCRRFFPISGHGEETCVSAVFRLARYSAGRWRGLSPGQVDDAIHLYNLGWSLARVGRHLGVEHVVVLNELRERGVPARDTHGRLRDEAGNHR